MTDILTKTRVRVEQVYWLRIVEKAGNPTINKTK